MFGQQLRVSIDEDVVFACLISGAGSWAQLLELAALTREALLQSGWTRANEPTRSADHH